MPQAGRPGSAGRAVALRAGPLRVPALRASIPGAKACSPGRGQPHLQPARLRRLPTAMRAQRTIQRPPGRARAGTSLRSAQGCRGNLGFAPPLCKGAAFWSRGDFSGRQAGTSRASPGGLSRLLPLRPRPEKLGL